MNPRMTHDWLRYLVTVGARRDDDGWRWKIDPTMRMGGFGPWRPQWSMLRLPGIGVPFLGVLGLELEVMGWGTTPADVIPNLPPGGRLEALEGVGHFVHIEQPRLVADLVLVHLTASGEGSGALAPMLERAAADLEREAERRITWIAALVQPLTIVAMGAIVLVLVLAIMLPIVSMNQLIR